MTECPYRPKEPEQFVGSTGVDYFFNCSHTECINNRRERNLGICSTNGNNYKPRDDKDNLEINVKTPLNQNTKEFFG